MRKVLKSSLEVFHYWANQVQSEGRVTNAFFEGDKCYSYGRHFCIGRILPSGTVAFTLRRYSNTTAKQISQARSAASHRQRVFCYEPSEGAAENMRHAQADIVGALDAAKKPRIRQTTIDGHRARALHLAEQANAYLAALPEIERVGVTPIDTATLDDMRDTMERLRETERRLAEDAAKARNLEATQRLAAWCTGGDYPNYGFHGLPVALRLGYQTIETSHGAEIPVRFAKRLWPVIVATRESGISSERLNQPCGVYTLNLIRGDGSIVVGCHDIPFSEIKRMAVVLGYITAEEAVEV